MIVRELVTRLGLDADDAERKAKSFDKAVKKLKVGLAAVVGAATGAGAALFGLVSSTASYGDALAKTADKLGIGIDALEQLRFAAEQSGIAQGTLEMALQRMTRRLAEAAAGGGEAKGALEELGLNAREIGKMAPEDALNVIADALAGVEHQADRVRLAFKFFDSEGVVMVNMLGNGAEGVRKLREEFERLSGGLRVDQVRAAERFGGAMTDLRTILDGLRLQIGGELLPVAIEWAEALKEWFLANREIIRQGFHRVLHLLVGTLRTLWLGLQQVIQAVRWVIEGTIGWERALRLLASFLGALALRVVARGLWAVAAGFIAAATGAKGLGAAMRRIPGMIFITLLTLAIEDFLAYLQGAPSLIGAIVEEIREILSDPDSWGSQALKIAIFAFDSIIRGAGMVRDAVVAAWDFIVRAVTEGGAGIIAAARDVGDTFRRVRDSVVGWAEDIWAAVERVLSAIGRVTGLSGLSALLPDGMFGPGDGRRPAGMAPSSWFGQGAAEGPSVTMPVARPGMAGVNVQIQEDVTVNVPAGTTQEQAREIDRQVRAQVAAAWQREIEAAMGDFPAYQGA